MFLTCVGEYANLILTKAQTKDEKIYKLFKSLEIMEKVKPLFLNRYFFIGSETLSNEEKKVVSILFELNYNVDNLFELIDAKEPRVIIENKIKIYMDKIISLSEEYRKSLKKVVRNDIIMGCKKNNM